MQSKNEQTVKKKQQQINNNNNSTEMKYFPNNILHTYHIFYTFSIIFCIFKF